MQVWFGLNGTGKYYVLCDVTQQPVGWGEWFHDRAGDRNLCTAEYRLYKCAICPRNFVANDCFPYG